MATPEVVRMASECVVESDVARCRWKFPFVRCHLRCHPSHYRAFASAIIFPRFPSSPVSQIMCFEPVLFLASSDFHAYAAVLRRDLADLRCRRSASWSSEIFSVALEESVRRVERAAYGRVAWRNTDLKHFMEH